MDELVRWLGVQLDADKARAAQWHDLECSIHEHQEGGLLKAVAALEVYGEVPGAVCDCGGPARVLREIDARRRTLIRCEEAMLSASPMLVHFAKQTVWEMALPYADRPGYKESWRP